MEIVPNWLHDANWVAAIGQVLGAIFTAIAAGVALKTTMRSVEATHRQTSIGAVQELLKDYASADLYDSLRGFGRFVAADPQNKEKFKRITEDFKTHRRNLDTESQHFDWVVKALEGDAVIQGQR